MSKVILSNEEMLLNILEAAKSSRVPVLELTRKTYDQYGRCSSSKIEKRLGSWGEAKKLAAKQTISELKQAIKREEQRIATHKKEIDLSLKQYKALSDKAEKERLAQLEMDDKIDRLTTAYLKLMSTKKPFNAQDVANSADLGSRDVITRTFGSMANLEEHARETRPDEFHDIEVSSLFSDEAFQELDEIVQTKKRFVVTTAVTGCDVDEAFYKAIKVYCEENDAALLILIASDPAHNRIKGHGEEMDKKRYGNIDKRLANERVILKNTYLNENLFLSTLKTSAKMINPLTGVERLVQQGGSMIIASPKQLTLPVAVSNVKLPHIAMSTGAITVPDYSTTFYMSERLADLADGDHCTGAVIVELDGDLFHYRQIQADKIDGSFYDIANNNCKRYSSEGSEPATASALVLGDWHSGETDPNVIDAMREVASIIHPDTIVIHDGFNGTSINHHEQHDIITRSLKANKGLLNLSTELLEYAYDLEMISGWNTKSVTVVKSNHDVFLARYLKEGMYTKDPQNHHIALKLALAMMEQQDPLQFGIMSLSGCDPHVPIKWLTRDEDFKVAHVQLGAHGDQGPNGSRGSLRSIEKAYAHSVTGHSHVPQILRGAWSVGTCSLLRVGYNEGPSSWMQSSCIVYPNGSRQLINVINGEYMI